MCIFFYFLGCFPLSPSGSLSKYYESYGDGVDSVIVDGTQSTLLNDSRQERATLGTGTWLAGVGVRVGDSAHL